MLLFINDIQLDQLQLQQPDLKEFLHQIFLKWQIGQDRPPSQDFIIIHLIMLVLESICCPKTDR